MDYHRQAGHEDLMSAVKMTYLQSLFYKFLSTVSSITKKLR